MCIPSIIDGFVFVYKHLFQCVNINSDLATSWSTRKWDWTWHLLTYLRWTVSFKTLHTTDWLTYQYGGVSNCFYGLEFWKYCLFFVFSFIFFSFNFFPPQYYYFQNHNTFSKRNKSFLWVLMDQCLKYAKCWSDSSFYKVAISNLPLKWTNSVHFIGGVQR